MTEEKSSVMDSQAKKFNKSGKDDSQSDDGNHSNTEGMSDNQSDICKETEEKVTKSKSSGTDSQAQDEQSDRICKGRSVMEISSEGDTTGNEQNARGWSSEIEDTPSNFTSAIWSIKEDDDTKYVSKSDQYVDSATCHESSSYKESDNHDYENDRRWKLLKHKRTGSIETASDSSSPLVRKRRRTVTKTGGSSDPAKESTGDSGVECGEKRKTRHSTCKKPIPHAVVLGIKSLKKARARFLKKPKIGSRLRILSPVSMKTSSDGKIYTTMTVTRSGSDPSPPEPGVFALAYATEVKEVAHRGPNVESHTDTIGM